MLNVKCVVIGDTGSGKTSSLITYVTNQFPQDYIPFTFGPETVNVMVDGKPISLSLMDTQSYDIVHTRMVMDGADVFLIYFDISNHKSFLNASEKWKNEVQKYNMEKEKNIPFLLVGCKSDLRECGQDARCIAVEIDDADILVHGFCRDLNNKDLIGECFRFYYSKMHISRNQGEQKAVDIGADCYQEHSCLTSEGLLSVYNSAVRAASSRMLRSTKRKRNDCVML